MKKIITALAEPQLNNELKKEKDFIVIGKDIQYQEGVIEILETEKEVDFLIISEALPGNEKIENLIEKIKQINNEVNIVIILENKKEELEKNLYSKNVYLILYNKIEIKEIIKLIKNKKEDENEKIKKEINDLKKIIIEQNSKNKQNKKQKIKEVKELNSQKEIICILGSGGVGKSIFTVNLAKSLIYSKKKILIIDFDILNNSLHTILGVKKYSEKISKKIKENNLIKDKIGLKELKIKINKRIDLISGINLLFDSKYKINNIQFNNLFNDVKKFYDVIIIDTSSECFFNYTKDIIKKSNINIFIVEPNLLEIQKSKNILKIYKEEWNIDNNEINILFNKFNKNSIDINILKIIFSEYNIIGKIDINNKYNLIINKNANKAVNAVIISVDNIPTAAEAIKLSRLFVHML